VRVTSRPAEAQHLRDLARLRRVRDRIDREYAQPTAKQTSVTLRSPRRSSAIARSMRRVIR